MQNYKKINMNAFYMIEQIPVLVSDTRREKCPYVAFHGTQTHEHGICLGF